MKWFVTLLVVAALGAGGYFVWRQYQRKQAEAAQANEIATALAESRDIRFAVSAAGDIGPADQVSVRPEIGGKLAELPVDIGDRVKSNSLLCRLDDKELAAERDSRLTEIDGAKLQLEKCQRSFKRNQQLFADKLISQEVFDDSRTDYHLSTNALERAQKALNTVNEKISKSVLLAPFDCTVLTRPVSLGQTVSGSAGYNAGTGTVDAWVRLNIFDRVIGSNSKSETVSYVRKVKKYQEVYANIYGEELGLRIKAELKTAPQTDSDVRGYVWTQIFSNVFNW